MVESKPVIGEKFREEGGVSGVNISRRMTPDSAESRMWTPPRVRMIGIAKRTNGRNPLHRNDGQSQQGS